MQHISGACTNYLNRKRNRAGHLFQGRCKAILVDADAHAKELSRYIHLNPVRAGIGDLPETFKLYLSHRYSGMKLREIGQRFGIGESGVTPASLRIRATINKVKKLRWIVTSIEKKLPL